MASETKQKPFNLLYKQDLDNNNIDKVYSWITGPGRAIVVGTMGFVILCFLIRFPLDAQLRNQLNLAKTNDAHLAYYAGKEQTYRGILSRTSAAKNFINIDGKDQKLSFNSSLKVIREMQTKYNNDINIINYSYSLSPGTSSIIILTGSASTYPKAEEFRVALRDHTELFSTASITNLGAQNGGNPQFSITLTIKP